MSSYRYGVNWLQNQQLFAYSAANTSTGDTESVDGNFYIILHSPPKEDTANPTRQLQGVLMPWNYAPDIAGGSITQPVEVIWQQAGGTAETLIQRTDDLTKNDRLRWADGFQLGTKTGENFSYTPDSYGDWTYGTLTTKNIKTASLGVWTGPDWSLTDAQANYLYKSIAPGQPITGYEDLSTFGNVGGLIQHVGGESAGWWEEDSLERAMMRCVLQLGHPVGIWTDTASYTNIGPSGTTYLISVPEYYPYASNEIDIYPTVIVTPTGASSGDKAYVKISSSTASDTWELGVETNSLGMYDYTDASNDKLTVDVSAEEEITIELKAPSSGELLLHTVALWMHPFN